MSSTEIGHNSAEAAEMLSRFSGNDFADFFVDGFRAYAVGRTSPEDAPFEPVYGLLFDGDEITDDLAAVYRELASRSYPQSRKGPHRSFSRGLCAAFDRLSFFDVHDRTALQFVLRLGAKIQCVELLAFMARKPLPEADADQAAMEAVLEVASESILNLVAGNADAADYLRDMIRSRFFRAEDVDIYLTALCELEAPSLLEHLTLLEDGLVEIYGDTNTQEDDELYSRRLLFVLDLAVPISVLGDVMDYALTTSEWRLAWIGHILIERDQSQMSGERHEKAEHLLDLLLKRRSKPKTTVAVTATAPNPLASLAYRRAAVEILRAEELDPEAESGVALFVVCTLSGRAAATGVNRQ